MNEFPAKVGWASLAKDVINDGLKPPPPQTPIRIYKMLKPQVRKYTEHPKDLSELLNEKERRRSCCCSECGPKSNFQNQHQTTVEISQHRNVRLKTLIITSLKPGESSPKKHQILEEVKNKLTKSVQMQQLAASTRQSQMRSSIKTTQSQVKQKSQRSILKATDISQEQHLQLYVTPLKNIRLVPLGQNERNLDQSESSYYQPRAKSLRYFHKKNRSGKSEIIKKYISTGSFKSPYKISIQNHGSRPTSYQSPYETRLISTSQTYRGFAVHKSKS